MITVSAAPAWTPNQFVYVTGTQPKHYYALIGAGSTTNPKEGHTYTVIGNSGNTVTVDTTQDTLTGIPENTPIVIIPYWTLATVFPATDQNVSFTPTTSTSAYKTQIRIPDYNASGTNLPHSPVYFFSNNVDGTSSNVGWRAVGNNTTNRGDDPLIPDAYFVVRNDNGAPTLPLIHLGSLLTKKLAVPLRTATTGAQDNPVAIARPFDVALNATGLGPWDGSFVASDQLLLFDNSQAGFNKAPSAIYYYTTPPIGNSGGWRLTGDASNDRGNDVISAGTGFVIRKAATAGGQTTFWTNAAPVSALSAASRKTHGTVGVFDVNLPLSGTPAVESRAGQGASSNDHKIVITFPTAVTFTGAAVTSGPGNVAATVFDGPNTVIIDLTGVTNAQRITVTLIGVSDGKSTNDVAVRMGVLAGDTTNDGFVNSADIGHVSSQSGTYAGPSNFRTDLNVDGFINSADISFVSSKSGTGLP